MSKPEKKNIPHGGGSLGISWFRYQSSNWTPVIAGSKKKKVDEEIL